MGRLELATTTFDTLAAVRALEAAGVGRKQAEAHAEQHRAVTGTDFGPLATKADIPVITAKLGIVQSLTVVQAVLILAMAARQFGAV